MRKWIDEFKKFALRGNVVDLAVGVVMGSAFTAIVNSLVNDIISPIIGLLVQQNFADLSLNLFGVTIGYGAFIMAVVNFLIVALVLFAVIKLVNRLPWLRAKQAPAAPTTKKCPYCMSEIDIHATRCPHCTSNLE